MRIHRVFVPALRPGEVSVRGEEARHLAQVLRVRPGARVRAFDGAGLEAEGQVLAVEDVRVTLQLAAPGPSQQEASVQVTLAVALLKGDKLAEVVRRGTELGAFAFAPFYSRYADVDKLSANKLMRWRRIAKEAAKQSGRSVVPQVDEALSLADLPLAPLTLLADPRASASLNDILGEDPLSAGGEVLIVSGPEGGLSEAEVEALVARGAKRVSLGARILRAETAPIALCAALLIPDAL